MKVDLMNDKVKIFNTLLLGVETAIDQKSARLFIKQLVVLGNKLEVVAERTDWLEVLKKAQDFFESIEDYEKCAKCKALSEYLKNNELGIDADQTQKTNN